MTLGVYEDDVFVATLSPYAIGVSQGVCELCRDLPRAGFRQLLVLRVGRVGGKKGMFVSLADFRIWCWGTISLWDCASNSNVPEEFLFTKERSK